LGGGVVEVFDGIGQLLSLEKQLDSGARARLPVRLSAGIDDGEKIIRGPLTLSVNCK
jgi:hypothetical protein